MPAIQIPKRKFAHRAERRQNYCGLNAERPAGSGVADLVVNGPERGFCAILDTDFLEQSFKVHPDRRLSDTEGARNFSVGSPPRYLAQDGQL
jgi:hypothetical protein